MVSQMDLRSPKRLKGLHLSQNFRSGIGAAAYFYTKRTTLALRAPWQAALYSERSGYLKVWNLPFGWRLTFRPSGYVSTTTGAAPESDSPYFIDAYRKIISVELGDSSWIIWNWEACSWDSIVERDRAIIKESEKAFFKRR